MNILEWLNRYGHAGLNTALLIILAIFLANRINTEITMRENSHKELRASITTLRDDAIRRFTKIEQEEQAALAQLRRELTKLETQVDALQAAPELTTEQIRFRAGIDKTIDRLTNRINRLEQRLMLPIAPRDYSETP